VTEEWRKLHSGELHVLYSSPNIIRQLKSRTLWWAGDGARVKEERKLYKVWWEIPKEGNHSEDQGIDDRIESE
jgi:hypothetical protein